MDLKLWKILHCLVYKTQRGNSIHSSPICDVEMAPCPLLDLDLAILFDRLDVLILLKGGNGVLGERYPAMVVSPASADMSGKRATYEKPLISAYSWPILPPCSVACFFALPSLSSALILRSHSGTYAVTCSSVASSLHITLMR